MKMEMFKGTGRDYRRIPGKIFYQKCSGRPGDDSTSGTVLVEETTRKILYEKLYPKVSLLTPNIPETGIFIRDKNYR